MGCIPPAILVRNPCIYLHGGAERIFRISTNRLMVSDLLAFLALLQKIRAEKIMRSAA